MAGTVRSTMNSLSEEARIVCVDILNDCLANTLYAVLASKFAHWNVKGTGFYPAHKLFDEVYEFYSGAADTLAERITALGGDAEGLLTDVASSSTIEYGADETDQVHEHIQAMATMISQVANQYRQGIEIVRVSEVNDQCTQDVFIELAREADKFLYFLEADLRKQ